MTPSRECVLLADIGATNARFAVATNGALGTIETVKVAEFPSFTAALHSYFQQSCSEEPIGRAMVAVAGPVKDGRAALTNAGWVIDAEELRSEVGAEADLINDFEAVAYSVHSLNERADLAPIGSGRAEPGAPIAVVGPGTGLGVACSISKFGKPTVIASEGGHTTLAGACEREDTIIQWLRLSFGHVSAERAVSGPGLENLFSAIASIDRREDLSLSAAEITENALAGKCSLCSDALETFCTFLGSFAGNAALTFRATGGVYIAGGISPRIVEFLRRSKFRQRFEAKGRFSQYLRSIPSFVITHPAAAFLGLMSLTGARRPRHDCDASATE
jgi:glucokinase